ncbi:MAG: response regulator, partial [Verrucomicrobiae bacterium]|nr:response regulator [Verrucomicrobiae bacterium]
PPLAARILRVVETYDTLRRCHADQLPDDAAVFNWMRNQPAGTFDVDALETLIHIRRSESAIRNMELFSQTVLLVSSQPKDLHPLCLRLQNDDYKVLTARSVPEALQHLHQQPVSLVLTDYHFPAEQTGLDLLRTVKNDPNLHDIPVVVHDTPDTDLVKKTLQLGAEDWYPKPANVEITALKLGRILQRLSTRTSPPAGVQGNLREMPLLDIVQILSVNRRSVQIQLCRGSEEAQLFMHEGQIINATCRHLEGEAAALEILRWQDGTFWIHPLRQPPAVRITTSTETLLFHTGAQKPPPPPTIPPTTKSQPT